MSLSQPSIGRGHATLESATIGAYPIWIATALVAVASPTLIAFSVSPSATLFNQVAAFFGWGAFLLVMALYLPPRFWPRSAAGLAVMASLAVIGLAALLSPLWAATPWALSLSVVGTLMATALVAASGAAVVRTGYGTLAFKAFCLALVFAGVLSAGIGLVQVFMPSSTDGFWVAFSPMNGRAIGNLRQNNHLSSLLLWSSIAIVWLGESRVLRKEVAYAGLLLFIAIVFLTGSRTGMVGTGVLALWGLLDRRLSRGSRVALLLTPVAYAAIWLAERWWSAGGHTGFGAAARVVASDNLTSSRFAIWSNAWSMIKSHPWRGVGFGEFNFAWTLTPFPDRPNEFFDHTHDILLNFAVELGLPAALLVTGLLIYALVSAFDNALRDGRDGQAMRPAGVPPMQRAAFMVVAMIALHSLLEYPLWYAYFLLPTAFALGLCIERPNAVDAVAADRAGSNGTRPLLLCAMAMIFASTMVLADYLRVATIFSTSGIATPLPERIERGQHSIFFAHHADYAAATVAEHPSSAITAFKRAPHFLLDARLMLAWAQAFHELGDDERARYVAQRAKEFQNAEVEQFFAPCAAASGASAAARPFQCTLPSRSFTYEDFK